MNAGSGKPALTARIGIETGSVVVDAAGEIYGDAPNTAARMQGLADGILVTSRVQRQITGLFVAEERGSHELGAGDAVSAYTGERRRTPCGPAPSSRGLSAVLLLP